MIINTPALDYYRATTGSLRRYNDMVGMLIGDDVDDDERERWHFLQYRGDKVGAVAHGEAMQDGKASFIVQISGEASDDLLDYIINDGMNPTRIDVQYTIEKPEWWDSIEFMYAMELGLWNGPPRSVQARINRGNDTIYIGNRTSDRFIRVYVKERNFIRFEVEYKKKRALRAGQAIREGGRNAVAGMILSELKKLPEHPLLGMISERLSGVSDGVELAVERVKTTDIRRLKWLASLLPTIREMMNSHDYGHMVTGWFADLVDEMYQDSKWVGRMSHEEEN